MDGVNASTEHRYSAGLSIELGGTSQAPIALLAYPGASVTIGAATGREFGLRIPNTGVSADYWVLGGLRFRGAINAIELGGAGSTGWRVIGNDISCPNGDGQTGCCAASLSAHVQFLGNEVHDTEIVGASKQLCLPKTPSVRRGSGNSWIIGTWSFRTLARSGERLCQDAPLTGESEPDRSADASSVWSRRPVICRYAERDCPRPSGSVQNGRGGR
jgi:hypothetical protein